MKLEGIQLISTILWEFSESNRILVTNLLSFSLHAICRAIGDSNDISQNSQEKAIHLMKRENDVRLLKLTSSIDSLRKILEHNDSQEIESKIEEAKDINRKLCKVRGTIDHVK